jgi:hypothetical protein
MYVWMHIIYCICEDTHQARKWDSQDVIQDQYNTYMYELRIDTYHACKVKEGLRLKSLVADPLKYARCLFKVGSLRRSTSY